MAGTFKVFNGAKGALGKGAIALHSDNFRLLLVQSGGTALSVGITASTKASMSTDGTAFFASAGNYSASGKALAAVTYSQNGTAWRFDALDWSLSQTASMTKVFQAVVVQSAGWPLAYCCLSANAFELATGNKLIVAFDASGIFSID